MDILVYGQYSQTNLKNYKNKNNGFFGNTNGRMAKLLGFQ